MGVEIFSKNLLPGGKNRDSFGQSAAGTLPLAN